MSSTTGPPSPLGTAAHLPPGGLIAIAWSSVVLAGAFVVARTLIRIVKAERLGHDDYWIYLAYLILCINALLQTVQTPYIYHLVRVRAGLEPAGEGFLKDGKAYLRYEFTIIGLFWSILWSEVVDDGRGFCLRLVRWVLDCERNDMSPGLSLLHIRYGGLPTATKEVTEIINQSLFKGRGSFQRYNFPVNGKNLSRDLRHTAIRLGSADTGNGAKAAPQVMSKPIDGAPDGGYGDGIYVPHGAIGVRSDYEVRGYENEP
ncbi:hypothetical protein HO133_006699 [Letharia lupina]|uniref:Uncharacterized protein n=1 Tax=Letharia lupina TaxID=560253 RepID=A0A8H6F6Q1_9LECA|nr:uncharacterized protein HO133_006699 [Letharia lupina]KAF6217597.1 hypothetical protein HO133_006699 [Letharia lupina]